MRGFGVLDRMVMREVAAPAAMGFVVYTFLLMMRGLFALIEQIFVRGLPARDALSILAATLPHVVVMTIPMGFLFGVLLAVGRMSTDNEIVALQAGGIPARRMMRPVMVLAVMLALVNGFLFTEVIPRSSRSLKELKIQLLTSTANIGRIDPQVFYEDFPNILLYLRNVDKESGTWLGVVVYDNSNPREERLTLARRGRIVTTGEGIEAAAAAGRSQQTEDGDNVPWILLEDAVTHQFQPAKPETYRVNQNQIQLFRPISRTRGVVRYDLAMRERDTLELIRFLRGGTLEQTRPMTEEQRPKKLRTAAIELHKRFSIPAASIVFGLLALPLGVGSRSGGRGRGFVLSIGVILLYYVLNNNGELLALEGRVPVWLGIWLPNLALVALALVLIRRMGRWLGERHRGAGLAARLIRRWRDWRIQLRRGRALGGAPAAATGSIPLSLQRKRYVSSFPTLLDRYLARRLVAPIAFVLLSVVALRTVVELTDRIDEIGKNDIGADVVVAFLWNLTPQVILDAIPFGLLLGVLILLTVLERQHELTALKGAGLSLYRLMVPVVLVALAGVALMWILGESVVPAANREAERLQDVMRGNTTARSYRTAGQQWLLSRDDSSFYNFLRFHAPSQTLIRFAMYRIDEDMQLTFQLFAHRARYRNGAWIADSGWYRQIHPDGRDEFGEIDSPLELGITEGPNYFGQEYRGPQEMSQKELGAYIRELLESGYRPDKLLVRWHQKFSYPLAALVMVCLALPYGLNRGGRRVTTMQGVGLALALGIGYLLLVMVFGKLAEAAVLPPALGAWAPVILGLLFSINRMTTLRS